MICPDVEGKGCHGANVTFRIYGGLQALIKDHVLNADYVHCTVQAINLILNYTTESVPEVSTFFDHLDTFLAIV